MNAPYGNINRSSINKSAIIGIDDRLDHFLLEVGFFAGVASYLQGTEKGRVKGTTLAAFNHPYGQFQQSKNCGQVPGLPPMTSFAHLAATAESSIRIPSFKMTAQSSSISAGVDLRLAQPFTDQIVVPFQDLLKNLKHQKVPEFFELVNDLIKSHITYCKFELKCYTNLSFHHGLLLLALVWQPQP
jgi:histone deacetylase complex regulatory component SIN3